MPVEVSFGLLFKGFNIANFVLYSCVFSFLILFGLRLDNRIDVSYLVVVIPLWICHCSVFAGAITGTYSRTKTPPTQTDTFLRNEFVSMLFTTFEHAFILVFECMVLLKCEFGHLWPHLGGLPWTAVFGPLFGLSLLSVVYCIWALKKEKSFVYEFFYAVNVIEFVFIACKIDDHIDWSWAIVFIPLWVVLSLGAVGVLYALVLSIVMVRARHVVITTRRHHFVNTVLNAFLVMPALTSLVLLTGKLDSLNWSNKTQSARFSYMFVLAPLCFSVFSLLIMSIGNGGGNVWWFGMRKPFCTFLLDSSPCLRQYANVSYKVEFRRPRGVRSTLSRTDIEDSARPLRTVVPLTSLECPD